MDKTKNLQEIEVQGIRVLITKQLAESYGVESQIITNNFNNNKKRYIEGKHYIKLTGKEKAEFIKKNKIYVSYTKARSIYLWTEKGALLHAKSINTDKAWEVYEYLVDYYFRAKESMKPQEAEKKFVEPVKTSVDKISKGSEQQIKVAHIDSQDQLRWVKGMVVDIPDNKEAQNLIKEMRKYLVGMDAVLDTYCMYLKEEEFKKVGYTVNLVASKIFQTGLDLMMFSPHIIEKIL